MRNTSWWLLVFDKLRKHLLDGVRRGQTQSRPSRGSRQHSADFFISLERAWQKGRWHIESHYPTQTNGRLDPDFLPRCARKVRVCAFH
jgi:hypothetical protein